MDWDWAYTLDVLPFLLRGLAINLEATFIGFALALALGLGLALGRRSRRRWLSLPLAGVIEFVRSTPLLVQLYVLFFVLPEFGMGMSALATGAVGLGVHYSTYTSEVYRAGLESIGRGQWEAALVLDLSPYRTYRDVIIPQVIPRVLPAMGNYLIAMFKDSPLLSAITVTEMLQSAKIVGSENFAYLEPMTVAGALFLGMSLLAASGLRRLEGRLRIPGLGGAGAGR